MQTLCECIWCHSGLSAFSTPALADLNAGFPDKYVKKDENAAVGIEPVVQAMLTVGHAR